MKRALTAAAVISGLWLLAPAAQAQTGTARGKVLDSKGQPLQDAAVAMEFMGGITRKFEVKTNKKGEWMQVGMQPGPYKFTATKEGFQPSFIEVRVNLGDPTAVPDFKLNTMAEAQKAAGGNEMEGIYTDSHYGPCPEDVWAMLRTVVPRAGNLRAITFEFDDDYCNDLGTSGIRAELDRARSVLSALR